MTQRIARWDTGAVIWEGEAETMRDAIHQAIAAKANLSRANLTGVNLSGVNLTGADLSWANLTWANLSGANLLRANLSGANLTGADLSWANLTGANLSGVNFLRANLSWATGIEPARCTPLLMLLDQPGPMRAYKLVNERSEGHVQGGLRYVIGEAVSVSDANTDVTKHCGAGINVATLDWCLREWQPGYRILLVEFTAQDIAAIPTATDGKFRLKRCLVVAEKDVSELVGGVK